MDNRDTTKNCSTPLPIPFHLVQTVLGKYLCLGMSLDNIKEATAVGGMLFSRLVSGTRYKQLQVLSDFQDCCYNWNWDQNQWNFFQTLWGPCGQLPTCIFERFSNTWHYQRRDRHFYGGTTRLLTILSLPETGKSFCIILQNCAHEVTLLRKQ